MSRRISWVVLFVAIAVTLAAIVYSRQVSPAEVASHTLQQQQQQPSPDSQRESATGTPDTAVEKQLCTLTSAQSQDIAGVRLGMTVDEVLAQFPGSKEDATLKKELARPPTNLGESNFAIKPNQFATAKFPGLRDISLSLLDGRVSVLVANSEGREWKDVDEYVNSFVEGKTLPRANSWDPYVGLDTQLKSLTCDGFTISVFAGPKGTSVNYVKFQDMAADKELKKRQAKAEAQEQAKP